MLYINEVHLKEQFWLTLYNVNVSSILSESDFHELADATISNLLEKIEVAFSDV